ncbi:hypothetical protein Acr_15g0017540 [Actinidia rufa]|uniref:Uncharacterized protein n=1 Tax=Actinidia rufa TaxID=165716 RepID=A0A7J0FWU8_9ERIC|nr:hypothetical protein Acr_15g0017540 [Actinidia rufa]
MNGVAKCLYGTDSQSYSPWLPIRMRPWQIAGPILPPGAFGPHYLGEGHKTGSWKLLWIFFRMLQEVHPISQEVDKWRWKGQGKGIVSLCPLSIILSWGLEIPPFLGKGFGLAKCLASGLCRVQSGSFSCAGIRRVVEAVCD